MTHVSLFGISEDQRPCLQNCDCPDRLGEAQGRHARMADAHSTRTRIRRFASSHLLASADLSQRRTALCSVHELATCRQGVMLVAGRPPIGRTLAALPWLRRRRTSIYAAKILGFAATVLGPVQPVWSRGPGIHSRHSVPKPKAAWRTASSLNRRLYLVYGLRCMTQPSKSKYYSSRCVCQTWAGSDPRGLARCGKSARHCDKLDNTGSGSRAIEQCRGIFI
jgi:hypothetical protein